MGIIIDAHQAYQNHKSMREYFRAIDEGVLPLKRIKKLTKKEEFIREFVLGLKFTDGVDLSKLKEKYEIDDTSSLEEKCVRLANRSLFSLYDGRIRFTEMGKLFDSEISRLFF